MGQEGVFTIMNRVWRDYSLEFAVATSGIAIAVCLYLAFGVVWKTTTESLRFVSITNAGFLFVAGHIYSRVKQRRDAKRRRAQELFLEWYSPDIRESRIYVSRWLLINQKTTPPSLSQIEKTAADDYSKNYKKQRNTPPSHAKPSNASVVHEMDDPHLQEVHFFRIYQFFDRWALLIENADIDRRAASDYMQSYKPWYLNKFIVPWSDMEDDMYIKASLDRIAHLLAR